MFAGARIRNLVFPVVEAGDNQELMIAKKAEIGNSKMENRWPIGFHELRISSFYFRPIVNYS